MRNIVSTFIFLLMIIQTIGQTTFEESINEISTDISAKLLNKNLRKVVVLYVTDLSKTQTMAGKYIADIVSINIVNDPGNFKVFDRENLPEIVEAKKLMDEGYIDANSAKELGKILAVDAILIGNYTVFSSTLKLTIKALDVENGFVVAASMKDLRLTTDLGILLGININSDNANLNRGFNNQPINSSEDYNNPGTVNPDCKEKNTGDYCFVNNTKLTLIVRIKRYTELTLNPGQTQCFYNQLAGTYNYTIHEKGGVEYGQVYYSYGNAVKPFTRAGQISIEQCKSKTFTIK